MPESDKNFAMLRNCEIFSQLTDADLKTLLEYCIDEKHQVETELFLETDPSNSMYIIIDGYVAIERVQNGQMEQIAQFTRNEYFGQNGLFLNVTRGVRAVTLTPTSLIRIPRQGVTIQKLIDEIPTVSLQMVHGLISQVSNRIRAMNQLIRTNNRWVKELHSKLMGDKLMSINNTLSYREEYRGTIVNQGKALMATLKPTNFKVINDRYGHKVGDALLYYMGVTIQRILGDRGTAFRYTGNVVMILFLQKHIESAEEIMKEIVDGLTQRSLEAFGVTGSEQLHYYHTYLRYPEDCSNADELLDQSHANLMTGFKRESG